ncbi:MAG: histidine kinase [Tannerellaceae bacterium]|nr:histidine kinase [Tannerellaceae bacterium]
MKKEQNKTGLIIAAFLFSLGFTLIIKWLQNAPVWHASTFTFTASNFFTVILTGTLFGKLLLYNSRVPVEKSRQRIIPSIVLFILITIFISYFFLALGMLVLFFIQGSDPAAIPGILIRESSGAIKSLGVGLLIIYALFFYSIWQQAIKREQSLREENLSYKYRNLKNQVNPHFLFNSLNTLSEMIYTDTAKADMYIRKLAGIYRYILEHEESYEVLLNKEIEFVKNYFELQKERSGDKIDLQIDLHNTQQMRIVPVSIQTLVENALKHNVASEKQPLTISIYQQDEYICVSNPVQKKNSLSGTLGTGLENLKERVRLITGKEMVVNEDNNYFLVKLPVIENEL